MAVRFNVEDNKVKNTMDQNRTVFGFCRLQQNHRVISIHRQSLNHSTAAHSHTAKSSKAMNEGSRTKQKKKHKGKLVGSLLFHLK